MSGWIKVSDQQPAPGQLIVKRWNNGNVWAGRHVAQPKFESFDEWFPLPDEREQVLVDAARLRELEEYAFMYKGLNK